MKLHYFDQEKADADDFMLMSAWLQGYIPRTCLQGGAIASAEVGARRVPCWRCDGPREKCFGQPRREG